jgi:hypothetical protein
VERAVVEAVLLFEPKTGYHAWGNPKTTTLKLKTRKGVAVMVFPCGERLLNIEFKQHNYRYSLFYTLRSGRD